MNQRAQKFFTKNLNLPKQGKKNFRITALSEKKIDFENKQVTPSAT